MARHLSVVVILAIAAFVVLSFMTSFGGRTEQIQQMLPVAGVSERPQVAPEAPAPVPDLKPEVTLDSKLDIKPDGKSETQSGFASLSSDLLTGGAIAPKLENATIKAELGRSTWKFFHTMMARFPDKPTEDDSLALKTFIQLFARLYPCGDCARHFQKLLAQYPPQVSSRNAAAGWACFVHNQVNERLKKPLFDCNDLGDFYDCGCGDEKKESTESIGELKLEKEGLTKGG
ncbi:ERV/ALR sulfhydryl oxidase domain-containing protein [Hypoxylon rubiginosum]|uniref:ERV/ALR sulfhydryl oxidase domain-containing protein n=1 Tax=Hypoxylon rubiginosum TaxID=110542 RepID=A0ACB9ZBM0_9PEZI|nr:ERV/ALR sulfhydryl oxidase domain-containing protein [Hypoxylon rubiginosum]